MPASAGASSTTSAWLKPVCGREAGRLLTTTAHGRRAATSGGSGNPVSGAAIVSTLSVVPTGLVSDPFELVEAFITTTTVLTTSTKILPPPKAPNHHQ